MNCENCILDLAACLSLSVNQSYNYRNCFIYFHLCPIYFLFKIVVSFCIHTAHVVVSTCVTGSAGRLIWYSRVTFCFRRNSRIW